VIKTLQLRRQGLGDTGTEERKRGGLIRRGRKGTRRGGEKGGWVDFKAWVLKKIKGNPGNTVIKYVLERGWDAGNSKGRGAVGKKNIF